MQEVLLTKMRCRAALKDVKLQTNDTLERYFCNTSKCVKDDVELWDTHCLYETSVLDPLKIGFKASLGGWQHFMQVLAISRRMVIVKEYRVTLPVTVEEYMIAQLYTVLEALKEKGTFDQAEVVRNEPFSGYPLCNGQYSSGQFTHKVYRVDKQVPVIMRWLVRNALTLHERSWNCYPYTVTFMGQKDESKTPYVITESIHLADRGNADNPLNLPADKLKQREVIYIDVGAEQCEYATNESCKPHLYKSQKTGRGPFAGNWRETVTPVMTCYKLVTVDIKLLGFQNKVENYVHRYQARIMAHFHRSLVCLMDEWTGKTLIDIRQMEAAYALGQDHMPSEELVVASSHGKKKKK